MRAGPLRHRVVCDEPVTTQDLSGNGEEITNFVPAFKLWASIEPLQVLRAEDERLRGEQIIASSDTKITVRWSTQSSRIDPKWRLRHGDTIYNVTAATPDPTARRQIQILARSGLNSG